MAEVLIVVHLIIVLALVVVVLLQKSEGGGLGVGGGGSGPGGFMTTRGTANVLTRTTAFLAIAFFLTSIILSILATANRQPRSILDQRPAGTTQPAAPGAPAAPATGGGGVLDQLRPTAPQAPVSQ